MTSVLIESAALCWLFHAPSRRRRRAEARCDAATWRPIRSRRRCARAGRSTMSTGCGGLHAATAREQRDRAGSSETSLLQGAALGARRSGFTSAQMIATMASTRDSRAARAPDRLAARLRAPPRHRAHFEVSLQLRRTPPGLSAPGPAGVVGLVDERPVPSESKRIAWLPVSPWRAARLSRIAPRTCSGLERERLLVEKRLRFGVRRRCRGSMIETWRRSRITRYFVFLPVRRRCRRSASCSRRRRCAERGGDRPAASSRRWRERRGNRGRPAMRI